MRTIELRTTSREEQVDITRDVERRVTETGLDDGVCVLWSTHTTGGLTLVGSGGRLQLGRWQRVFFCEFDGPRTRNVLLHLLASA